MSDTRNTSAGGDPPSSDPTKNVEKKVETKEIKDVKEFKIEKNEKLEKSEFKEFKDHKNEKLEKNETKEHKDAKIEKLEKNEAKEYKDTKQEKLEKNEIKEHKDGKQEKLEKLEIKELSKIELPEKPIVEGPGGPDGPGGPVEERLATLEQSVASMQHFITSGQRPDLSRGALSAEPDAGRAAGSSATSARSRST
jgi:hypothetical protein